MFTIAKTILRVLFVALVVAGPMACLTINKSPDDQPKTQVNVGGNHGVTVDHDKDSGNNGN
jgi:hypothetical protein